MNLPKVITDLAEAQNNFDNIAYANCFSNDAVVFDEGKNHYGKKEIELWIADANDRYKATMKPLSFEEKQNKSILKVEASGNFPGSPIVMNYHLKIVDGLIESLEITG